MKKRISLKEVNRRLWEKFQVCYEPVNDVVTWISFAKETKTASFSGWKLEDEIVSHASLVLADNEELDPKYTEKMKSLSRELKELIKETYT